MGPTATIPYSHYWTFNHEENHDNFAGADHLDFDYQLNGMEREPVSGPDSKYDEDDIVHRRTAHDVRMREAITNLKWPLVQSFEAAPLRAGSVVFYSHNTFHRGNHRRHAFLPERPRRQGGEGSSRSHQGRWTRSAKRASLFRVNGHPGLAR